MSNQPCRYCGTELTRFEKLPDGKLRRYDKNGEHKYDICKALQNKKSSSSSYQPNHQVQLGQPSTSKSQISNYIASSSTFPVNEEPKPSQGVTIFSLHVTISELRREIKEMRKQIETTASIMDSMAQKQDLLIERIGYPEPKVVKGTDENMVLPAEQQKTYEENSKKFDETMAQIEKPSLGERMKKQIREAPEEYRKITESIIRKTDESGVLLKDGQEVKAIQRHPTEEELKEVINPMRVQKHTDKELNDMMESDAQAMDDMNRERNAMQWQTLSEAFLCHNCSGKFHNGYMKLGTKLCEGCKQGIEANESENSEKDKDKDRSDVNSFKVRSIEDINSEDVNF